MATVAHSAKVDDLAPIADSGRLHALLVLVVVCWGGGAVATKIAVAYMPALTAVAVRGWIAAVLLLIVLRLSGQSRPRVYLRDLPLLVALGLSGFSINSVLVFNGLRVASAAEATVIGALGPVFTVLLAALLIRERITLFQIGGLMLTCIGAAFVALPAEGFVITADHWLAILYLLGGSTLFAIYSVIGKFVLRRFSPLAATTYACAIGSALLVPIVLLTGDLNGLISAPAPAWIGILYLAVFSTLIPLTIWFHAVKRIGAGRTAIFSNAVPVATMFLGAVILHELVTPLRVLGVLLVFSGVLLAIRRTRKG